MEKFNKKEYDINYKKEHKAQFKVDLNKNEKIDLDLMLKKFNVSQVDFLRNAIRAVSYTHLTLPTTPYV